MGSCYRRTVVRWMAGAAAMAVGLLAGALAATACVGYLDADAGVEATDASASEVGPASDGDAGTGGDAALVDADAGCGYPCIVLADEPLVYLSFDDDVGPQARDLSGNERHGQYPVGGVTKGIDGHMPGSKAVRFSGKGAQAIKMPAGFADFTGTDAKFSIELWMKADDLSGLPFVLDHQTFSPRGGWLVRAQQGRIGLEVWVDEQGATLESEDPLTVGQWHHVVLAYDTTDRLAHVWVDTKLLTREIGAGGSLPVIQSWSIGKQNCSPCETSSYVGVLDEVALYDRVLDEATVIRHYRAARP